MCRVSGGCIKYFEGPVLCFTIAYRDGSGKKPSSSGSGNVVGGLVSTVAATTSHR